MHAVPADQLRRVLQAFEDASHSKTEAARLLGLRRTTYQDQFVLAQEALARGEISLALPTPKPHIRVPARAVYQPLPNEFGKAVRVFVFGCAHDAPNIPDKSRFRHAGLLASELKSDFIVDLGDSLDLDSLSNHAPLGSLDDRQRPFFTAEVASLTDAYAAFHDTAPSPDNIPRFHLHGNHENRAWRHEANNPASQGVFTTQIDQVFARMGWTVKNYREWLFIEGVGFTHCPVNALGREYGGKTAENMVLNETTFSVVWSHIHRMHHARRAKIGVGNGLQSYNTGTFLPQGYVKLYAGLSQTGWSYGVSELTLRDGQIESARFWSERELQERYA